MTSSGRCTASRHRDAARRHAPRAKSGLGRLAATNQTVHIADYAAEAAYAERDHFAVTAVERLGARSNLSVPLLKEGNLIGAISIFRGEVRPFADKQIELIESFAAQAVIAIENTRLLTELRESLERQTATSEVLQVISSSPGDLQPVFGKMLENAIRISGASFGIIHSWDGENLRLLATHNLPPAFDRARRDAPAFKPGPKSGVRRMAATKSVIYIRDLREDEGYLDHPSLQVVSSVEQGVRTMLIVPMLKESEVVGTFTVYRQEVRPFTDKQIDLVKNFAAQAVIAIENARLFTELRESLEQQTATSDVLRVISSSPGELEPVFNIILKSANRLCEANYGTMYLREGDGYRAAARQGHLPETVERLWWRGNLFQPPPGVPMSRAIAARRPIWSPTWLKSLLFGRQCMDSCRRRSGWHPLDVHRPDAQGR